MFSATIGVGNRLDLPELSASEANVMSAILCRRAGWYTVAVLAAWTFEIQAANAQNRGAGPLAAPGGPQNAVGNDGFFGPAGGPANGAPNNGAPGGAASADFDSLIDLITSTVDAESWAENGTGEGDIQPFFNGVYVDAAGALRVREATTRTNLTSIRGGGRRPLAAIRDTTGSTNSISTAKPPATADLRQAAAPSARVTSSLRYVSLSRLEAAIADCQRRHAPLDPAMLTLAGLQRVSYVLVYPETGDLVLAGPAGDWQTAPSGAIVSIETGRPVMRLDDLIALWRRQRSENSTAFGCSIVPRQEALARTQEFLNASAAKPLEPGGRRAWLSALRDNLGIQDVEYYNIDADGRIAGLLLAADYHMKLIGMGLAEGVPGVKSYLATVRVGPDGQPPAMSVLRWWFAMPASTVEATAKHDAFAMSERCIEVLSENEMLAARGQRVHTGQSEELNKRFATSFTEKFSELADKYPVYGELERVFELALVLGLVEREGLAEKVGWSPSLLLDEQRLRLPKMSAPKIVETVINHRVIGGRHIIAGISGGVWVDGGKSLAVAEASGSSAANLAGIKKTPMVSPQDQELAWWWD